MKIIQPHGNLDGFTVLGNAPPGACPECAVVHPPEHPHNWQSLPYQYKFRERTGAWPPWADAMAHCTDEVREHWTAELTRLGQDIGTVTPDKTKALALLQPWAWLMIRPDLTDPIDRLDAALDGRIKDIENRTWQTYYRGRVRVHASKAIKPGDFEAARTIADKLGITIPPAKELQYGGIIGEFTITNCVRSHGSPWFFGPYGFTVKDAKPLPFQPCRGMLGFFSPTITPNQTDKQTI